jgi:DNA repair protein RadC
VQAIVTIYQGCVDSSAVRIAEVFREPIPRTSKAIIAVHNHPSGDPTPSPEDVAITRQIGEVAKLLNIDLLDHLIIGQGRWTSLRERRLGFAE